MSLFSLTGKTAIITGGGSGIGEAISKAFAKQGAKVHVLELHSDKAKSIEEEIQSLGGKAVGHQCDVSNQEETKRVIKSISDKSKIDILINNAGIAHVGNIEGTTEADMDKLYQVNIKGVYNCILSCIETMKVHGGTILNMASIASTIGISDRFAYSMTKGAVLTMTYSIAKDYLDYGIRCNSISPARVHTPFVDNFIKKNYPGTENEMFEKLSKTQPIGRMGKPEEVAHLALYLCSDEASFITGTDFPIDGGYIKLNG
ncbi:SDR family NAD(P)-dependent oxidoreductase [Flagellimonas sp. S3867]|uniref:SDR family NAD(P)-dependent oxidoreductase n=1 Tax=Flagellimonas sp. S3867 TaxID=2768063 RepID=UPI001689AD9C|nr:SDR family oxidoreductase [Flagellimonas sp. S3867]